MATERTTPVIVGVDGSSGAMAALDLAAEEAVGRAAPLVVVHATGRCPGAEAADPLLDAAVCRARSAHPALVVAGCLLPGDPAELLARRSRDACLVVVGHRGRCGYGGVHVGSVAMRVLSLAEAPVIVHRPLEASAAVPLPAPVLVGVDATMPEEMMRFAFLEAALRRVPLRVMYTPASRGAPVDGIAEALDRWSEKYPEVAVRFVVRPSLDVAVVLAAASRTAGLVVVGLSGVGRPTRLFAGAVSRALIHRAACPVAVVPVP